MKSLRCLVPLAVFVVIVAFLWVGPVARSARGALAARRQARARVRARAAARAGQDAVHRRHEGPGVAAQRVGVVVRVVPRRASAAGRAREGERRAGDRPQLQGQARRRQARGSRSTAIRTSCRSSTRDGRVGIDWGVYGVPETFVVDKHGVDPLQADRPDHRARRCSRRSCRSCASCRRHDDALVAARALCAAFALALSALAQTRPRARRAPEEARGGAALPRLPEPVARRFQCAARRGPAPRGARAGRSRARATSEIKRVPGRALRRLRALQAAGQARPRGCCGSARSRCSLGGGASGG